MTDFKQKMILKCGFSSQNGDFLIREGD